VSKRNISIGFGFTQRGLVLFSFRVLSLFFYF